MSNTNPIASCLKFIFRLFSSITQKNLELIINLSQFLKSSSDITIWISQLTKKQIMTVISLSHSNLDYSQYIQSFYR